ncbi:cutinase family protein [Nocardia suismassiliense]|uniref:cutinase family protein n=1 Tax=Nocardia suismassiliense TaxID=2077092 RepID=UPI000D1FD2ED|nr:cutinase family protein [Nocardia suismassiliense]
MPSSLRPRRFRVESSALSTARVIVGVLASALTITAPVIGPASVASAAPACTSGVELVVARGTREPGYLGAEIGDPLALALPRMVDIPVTTYPVAYPAELLDPSSISRGTADLVQHLTEVSAACPEMRIVVAGYSQGAAVVHSALGDGLAAAIPGTVRIPPWVAPRIQAVLLFGDPLRLVGSPGLPGPWRTGSWCVAGDPVCQIGGLQPLAHVAYGDDTIQAAAMFAASAL